MKFMQIIPQSCKHYMQGLARSYRMAKDGVAAIEFALIAPVMLIMYMGMAEVTMLITTDRSVSHTAAVVADLVTQDDAIDDTEMEDILNAAIAVMGLNTQNTAKISIDVTSYKLDTNDNPVEIGYAKMGNGFSSPASASGASGTLLNQTSGLVIARIKYQYSSPTNWFVRNPVLTETFMLKPRRSKDIPFNSGPFTCTVGGNSSNPNTNC